MCFLSQQTGNTSGASISITYYTDPLCCWSWAFEKEWQQLLIYLRPTDYRYVMGGLLPDWHNYQDNSMYINRPSQLGPVWMQAKQLCGVEINDRIWIDNPPSSSYPACIAVKAAALQSFKAGETFLQFIRRAVMLDGANIARKEVLTAVAKDVACQFPYLLDLNRFLKDFDGQEAVDAFKQDLHELEYARITRFPTIIIKGLYCGPLCFTGFKPYSMLVNTIAAYGHCKKTSCKPAC